jgi:NADH-quinone oxidoreductase subunit J
VDPSVLSVFEVLKLSNLVFFAFATVAVMGAAGVAFSRNIVYAAFSLLMSLFGVAALFAWISADYLAITQLIVYVGGTLVLFLFAVMLTSHIREVKTSNPITNFIPGFVVATGLAGLLLYVAVQTPWKATEAAPKVTTYAVGDALLSQYLLPFEVLSVMILAALVGAVTLARKEVKE